MKRLTKMTMAEAQDILGLNDTPFHDLADYAKRDKKAKADEAAALDRKMGRAGPVDIREHQLPGGANTEVGRMLADIEKDDAGEAVKPPTPTSSEER